MQFDLPEDLNQGSRGNLIPFGKYKGQPIEVLAQDDQYRDWLMAQDWFRSRFPQLVQIVVNNFGAPSETPEHNQMQAAFLDEAWRLKFAVAVDRSEFTESRFSVCFDSAAYVRFLLAHDMPQYAGYSLDEVIEGMRSKIGRPLISFTRIPEFESGKKLRDVTFAVTALGVCDTGTAEARPLYRKILSFGYCDSWEFAIEIKPTIGDDYPSVLRQVRENGCRQVLYRNYTGSGVDEATFRKFFRSQKVITIREDEIREAPSSAVLSEEIVQSFVKGL